MSFVFPAIIIYLLPGFFAFSLFKNSIQEDLEKRAESTQIAIMLLFGFSGIALLFAVNYILSPFPLLAKYVSLEALLPVKVADELFIFPCDTKFWLSYAVLILLTIISGALWALLSERGLTPTRLLSRSVVKYLRHGGKIPCESAMRAITDEMQERGNNPSFVKVYNLGDKGNYVLGYWNGYSESEKEISLTLLECCDAATELHKDFYLQTRKCIINYDSGIVIEFLDISERQAKAFLDYAICNYKLIATEI